MRQSVATALGYDVSLVTLETFMSSFNALVVKAAETDKAFYEERGVVLHNLEVVRYEPKDAETVLAKYIGEKGPCARVSKKAEPEADVHKLQAAR